MTQNYQLPSRPSEPPVSEWFDAIASAPPPAEPPARKRKRVLLVVTIIVVLLAGSAAAFVTFQSSPAMASCLDAKQYTNIMSQLNPEDGVAPFKDIKPNSPVYGYSIYFQDGSTDYLSEQADDVNLTVKNLSSALGPADSLPYTLTLTTYAIDEPSRNLAERRLSDVKQSLIDAGVPKDNILASIETLDTAIEDASDPSPVLLNVSFKELCK